MKKLAVILGLAIAAQMLAVAQEIQLNPADKPAAKKNHVLLLDDALTVEAGKARDVEIRFRVDAALHINSHEPKDELLLPTVLTFEPGAEQKITSVTYPAGTPFHLNVGEGEMLDVYQGEFRVRVRLTAPRGASTLTGALHYQACDTAACFPPRTLPVKIVVTGR